MAPPMNPRLETLPAELILMIAYDHLDEADRVSLTLTNHRLHHKLGSNTYKNLSSHSKYDFLSRLARDLPNTYVCFYCEKLHPSQSIRLPGIGHPIPPKPLTTCPEQNPDLETELSKPVDQVNSIYFNKMMAYKLRFCHVALVMQRYRMGPSHGIPVEWLSSTIVYGRNQDHILRLLSVEAKIAPVSPARNNASLILQIQAWAMHVGSGAGAGAGAAQTANTRPPNLKQKICNHTKLNTAVATLTEDTPGKLAWYNMTCADCGIEPHVYTRDYGGGCKALVVTRWLDLGPGLDIRDYQWNAAVQGNFQRWYEGGNSVKLVKERFLGATGRDFLEMTTHRNEGYLLNQQYLRLFEPVEFQSEEVWVLSPRLSG